MEKFIENLEKAEKHFQTAGHLTYVTYPLIKDKKLLLKVLMEIKNSLASCMNSILQYEYIYNRVKLSSEPKINFRTFLEKCCPRYGLGDLEVQKIIRVFELAEKHKKSPMEFVKDNKVVIMSENLHHETISLEKIKEFLELSKKLTQNAKDKFFR